LVLGYRLLVDWLDRRTSPPAVEEPFAGPLYSPAFEPEPEVVEGHVMVSDALGEWAPTEHAVERALIADALMVERPWLTLHKPPLWSAWTGVHPVVRLADLECFGAMA
jgi:hypothetical protein